MLSSLIQSSFFIIFNIQIVLDYDDIMKIPIWGDQVRRDNKKYESFNVR